MPKESLEIPKYIQNRELSWLKFNERVLHEATRVETPILERLRFISIFSNNLDEFFMIRVGTFTDVLLYGKKYIDNKTGMTAQQQLDVIFHATTHLYSIKEKAYSLVISELSHHGVQLLSIADLDSSDLKKMRRYFTREVMPFLSPQIIDNRHPFPHISNKQMHVFLTLEGKRKTFYGMVAIPSEMNRLVSLGDDCRFILLETLVWYFCELLFDDYTTTEKTIIAVTRNADIDTNERLDEDMDFRIHMQNLIKRRQRLAPVRLEMVYPSSTSTISFLCERLNLNSSQVFISSVPPDLSFGFNFERYLDKEISKNLIWPIHIPVETIPDVRKTDMFRYLEDSDLVLSYPFESMSALLRLVRQAVEDPFVISIKITFYRIDKQSKLAESLIYAVENGKEVTVLMELRARFDEVNNIEWAERLQEAGCNVVYGLEDYKVHSKICLITRKGPSNRIKYITQIGTGNFNERTSRQYTDLSFITANQEIGVDAAAFFNNMLRGNLNDEYSYLWVAPNGYKSNVIRGIEEERQKALNNEVSQIIIKCNSLTDKDIIEKLVEASIAGVEIKMIVRGISCLISQIPDYTENIHIISIIGRFLEHSRIFCFGVGSSAKVYISSADLMTRNTERRIEIACPIFDSTLKSRLIAMLEVMLKDNVGAWVLSSDGSYIPPDSLELLPKISSQEYFTKEAQVNATMVISRSKNNDKLSLLVRIAAYIKRLFKKKSQEL